MPLGQMVFPAEGLLLIAELKQPQLIVQGGLRHPQPLGRLLLGTAPQRDHILNPPGLFKGVQILALHIFQKAQCRGGLVLIITQNGRDLLQLSQLAGPKPSLPCHQLIPLAAAADRNRLQQAILQNAHRQLRDLLFIKVSACLIGRRVDQLCGNGKYLSLHLGFARQHSGTSFLLRKILRPPAGGSLGAAPRPTPRKTSPPLARRLMLCCILCIPKAGPQK